MGLLQQIKVFNPVEMNRGMILVECISNAAGYIILPPFTFNIYISKIQIFINDRDICY